MKRFVYRPEIEAYIYLEDAGRYIDVSKDIIDGTITRRLNAVSDASLTLQNRDNRYIRVMKPMDRIAIWLTRTKRMLVFSGYLDEVPLERFYPGPVTIKASCTLKLLQNTYFDPGLPFMIQFFQDNGNFLYNPSTGTLTDAQQRFGNFDQKGGWATALKAVLNKIGGFPKDHVHITGLPKPFLHQLAKEMVQVQDEDNSDFQALLTRLETLMNSPTRGLATAGNTDFGSSNANSRAFQVAGKKHLRGLLDGKQQYNASVIWGVGKEFGLGDLTIIGLIAAAYAESTLRANALESGGSGAGLFQLTSPGYYGADGWLARAYKKDHPHAHVIPINPTQGGSQLGDSSGLSANALYNTRAFVMANITNNYDTISNPQYLKNASNIGVDTIPIKLSGEPYKQIICYWERPKDFGKGDISRADKLWPYLKRTLQDISKASATTVATTSQNTSTDPEANVKATHGSARSGHTVTKPTSVAITHYPAGTVHVYDTMTPTRIVIHSSESDWTDGLTLPNYWNSHPGSGSSGPYYLASQYGINHNGDVFQWADNTDLTYHTGGANTGSIGIELSGFASQTGDDWRSHSDQLENLARLCAVLCNRYKISAIANTETGLSRHLDQSAIHPESNGHSDPGLGFPWLWFINRVRKLQGKVALTDPTGGAGTAGLDTKGLTDPTQQNANLGFFSLQLQNTDFAEATLLQGKRALANDISLFDWINTMATAGGRAFCSLPNGDFYAFFPDYFRWFGERTPYFTISDIEIVDLNIQLSDRDLKTHVFTAGSRFTDKVETFDRILSQVASVEDTNAFNVFINRNGEDFNPLEFLSRYGARPEINDMPEVRQPLLLWMASWMKFAELWSGMYMADAEFTFMPELLPGGLVDFSGRFTMYVEEVTHNIDRVSGYSTTASLKAPSSYSEGAKLGPLVLPNTKFDTTALDEAADKQKKPTKHLPPKRRKLPNV